MSTLYLEVDEDITSAVEKLVAADDADVQVVVPKRSTLLQSMINLKLLKKAADQHKKNLVLVTTDRLSSHLAGRSGIAVAAKLGAEAAIPESEVKEPDSSEVIDGGVEETGKPEVAAAAAGVAAGAAMARDDEAEPTVDSGSDDSAADTAAGPQKPADEPVMKQKPVSDKKPASDKPKKGNKVPDFNGLQKRVLWVALGVFILGAVLIANYLMGSAKVTVFAKGTKVPAEANFTADPSAPVSDVEKGVLKAQSLSSSKDLSTSVPATGKKDVGTRASGTMTISNGFDSSSRTLPAGTKFTASGKTFLSQSAVTVPGAGVSGGGIVPGKATVAVQADQAGDSYNLAPTAYTIAGQPSQVTGQGGQMSGGTSKQITVVSQGDVDKAVAKMLEEDKDGAMEDLKTKTAQGYEMIPETFVQTPSNISSDPAVDSEASNATVKLNAAYSALAILKDDLKASLEANIKEQVGPDNQIYETGVDSATFQVTKKNPNGSMVINAKSEGSAGPKIDTDAIAKEIKGKKYGEATEIINKTAGVDRSEIKLSPAWQTRLPGRTSQIDIEIKVAESGG